jgi:hypothetical protein
MSREPSQIQHATPAHHMAAISNSALLGSGLAAKPAHTLQQLQISEIRKCAVALGLTDDDIIDHAESEEDERACLVRLVVDQLASLQTLEIKALRSRALSEGIVDEQVAAACEQQHKADQCKAAIVNLIFEAVVASNRASTPPSAVAVDGSSSATQGATPSRHRGRRPSRESQLPSSTLKMTPEHPAEQLLLPGAVPESQAPVDVEVAVPESPREAARRIFAAAVADSDQKSLNAQQIAEALQANGHDVSVGLISGMFSGAP